MLHNTCDIENYLIKKCRRELFFNLFSLFIHSCRKDTRKRLPTLSGRLREVLMNTTVTMVMLRVLLTLCRHPDPIPPINCLLVPQTPAESARLFCQVFLHTYPVKHTPQCKRNAQLTKSDSLLIFFATSCIFSSCAKIGLASRTLFAVR